MLRAGFLSLCFCVLLAFAPGASAEVRIASWNIQHLGWGENKHYPVLGVIGGMFDFIAVQEAMSEAGLERLVGALEEATGAEWEMLYSHPVGRSSYREKYAFVWRSERVDYVDGATLYLDTTDRFAREPYSARFRITATGEAFLAATVHILYGDSVGDRTPEIRALRAYWDWLGETWPEEADRRLLLGDFNLAPSHPAWAPLKEVAEPLITRGATTLSTIDGRYANLYDNIWVPRDHDLSVEEAGIVDFPAVLNQIDGGGWTHERARRHVSDHAPVYVLLGVQALITAHLDDPSLELEGPRCIDLNQASAVELEQIIHIGPARARQIKAGRPWGSIDELSRISGLGAGRLEEIRQQGLVCG